MDRFNRSPGNSETAGQIAPGKYQSALTIAC